MTIKTKLTLNAASFLLVILAVAGTSLSGMLFVREKLSYLTERSTPFQVKTLQFDRAVQACTAALMQVASAVTKEEGETSRTGAETALTEVRRLQDELETLSGGQSVNAHGQLKGVADGLSRTTGERLASATEAASGVARVAQQVGEASGRLQTLESKIKELQRKYTSAYLSSLEDTKKSSEVLTDLEDLRPLLKDAQVALQTILRAPDAQVLALARSKFSAAWKALAGSRLESGPLERVRGLQGRVDDLANARKALLEGGAGAAKTQQQLETDAEAASEALGLALRDVERQSTEIREQIIADTDFQGGIFNKVNQANEILNRSAELALIGASVEKPVLRLLAAASFDEVNVNQAEVESIFKRMDPVKASLANALRNVNAKAELGMLLEADRSFGEVRSVLLSQDGVFSKVRRKLDMRVKADQATEQLRQIVGGQLKKGRETVLLAHGEQERAIQTVNGMIRLSLLFIAVITAASVLFGSAFGVWVYRSIVRRLRGLIAASERVAEGDLSFGLSSADRDEVGAVQAAVGRMVSRIRDMVGQMRGATEKLSGSAAQLSSAAASLETASGRQSIQVEQSDVAMTEMAASIEDVAGGAADTSSAANEMKRVAGFGVEAMNATVADLGEFASASQQTYAKVELLGQRSQEIDSVVELIKDIADQTNLLSLNASIEAARAGAQGRGFAVVADHVRQLAERTASATAEISRTIHTMRADISAAVGLIGGEKESIDRLVERARTALHAMDGIFASIERVTDMVQRIAGATEEQSCTTREVSHSMAAISGATKDVAECVAQIRLESGQLSAMVLDLNQMAAWFRG